MSDADVCVVGGGLAGAATAIALARGGARTILLDRHAGPAAKVCGEFLSNVAVAELEALGLPPAASGAVPLATFRMAARGDAVTTALPFPAASLTRCRLDAAMLERAENEGVTVLRGVTVRSLAPSGSSWSVAASGGRTWQAGRAVIASGKTDVAGRRRGPGLHRDLVGLKLYAELTPAAAAMLGDAVEIVLFPGGYCGIQPVEDGRANICLVIERGRLKTLGRAGAAFEALRGHSRRADALLAGARFDTGAPLAVAGTPYGFVRRTGDGVYHVGDQMAVIPSFCGEGMGIALVSGRIAAAAILGGVDAGAYHRALAARLAPRVRAAALASRLVVREAAQRPAIAMARVAPWLVRAAAGAMRTPA